MTFSSLSERPCAGVVLPPLDDGVLLFVFKPGPLAAGLRGLYENWLSADEVQRLRRFRFDEHREEYLHGRALTRFVLSEYLGADPAAIRFDHNGFGKPHVDPALGLQFNLSHTKGVNVLAVTRRGRIGVDLEFADPARAGEDISSRFFTRQEHLRLLGSPRDNRAFTFFSTWTLKESFVKAVGQGLSLPLSEFAFEFNGDSLHLLLSDKVPTTLPLALRTARRDPCPALRVVAGAGRHARLDDVRPDAGGPLPARAGSLARAWRIGRRTRSRPVGRCH